MIHLTGEKSPPPVSQAGMNLVQDEALHLGEMLPGPAVKEEDGQAFRSQGQYGRRRN
jgi:hypothetical protein